MKFNRKGNRIKEYMTTKDPNYTKDIDEIWDDLISIATKQNPRTGSNRLERRKK